VRKKNIFRKKASVIKEWRKGENDQKTIFNVIFYN